LIDPITLVAASITGEVLRTLVVEREDVPTDLALFTQYERTTLIAMGATLRNRENELVPRTQVALLVEGRDFPTGTLVAAGNNWDSTKSPTRNPFFPYEPPQSAPDLLTALIEMEAKLADMRQLIAGG
jgi:hypothetical protein